MPTASPDHLCRTCGAEVSPNATGCSKCGAELRGEGDQSQVYDGLSLPDDDFDYNEFVRSEFGSGENSEMPKTSLQWFYWVAAIILLVALGFLFFRL